MQRTSLAIILLQVLIQSWFRKHILCSQAVYLCLIIIKSNIIFQLAWFGWKTIYSQYRLLTPKSDLRIRRGCPRLASSCHNNTTHSYCIVCDMNSNAVKETKSYCKTTIQFRGSYSGVASGCISGGGAALSHVDRNPSRLVGDGRDSWKGFIILAQATCVCEFHSGSRTANTGSPTLPWASRRPPPHTAHAHNNSFYILLHLYLFYWVLLFLYVTRYIVKYFPSIKLYKSC